MKAGYGAEDQASRRARRAAERRRDLAANEAAGSAVEAELERLQRQQRNWSQGAEGERQVASALEPLAQFGWLAAHDVHWPGRPQANIDHIAVGPGGVVVIDAKNWTGAVTVENGALRQNGYAREREAEGAAQAAAAVTALLAPQHRGAVRAVICLAGQEQDPVLVTSGVTVIGRHQLAAWLATLPVRLTPYDVADLGRHLQRALASPQAAEPLARPDTRWVEAGRTRAPSRRPARTPRAPAPARRTTSRGSTRSRRRSGLGEELFRLVIVIIALLAFVNYVPRLLG